MMQQPRARREGLVIKELPGEVLVYDLERDKAHCLNQTAAIVWKHCDGKTSVKGIADLLANELRTPVDEKLVWLALDQFGRHQLLEEKPALPSMMAGLNRRQMVRALGLAALVAVPLVTTIVAPTPAQAATCLPNGSACTSGAQCCSTICNAGVCA